jgi:hypothetical protein
VRGGNEEALTETAAYLDSSSTGEVAQLTLERTVYEVVMPMIEGMKDAIVLLARQPDTMSGS